MTRNISSVKISLKITCNSLNSYILNNIAHVPYNTVRVFSRAHVKITLYNIPKFNEIKTHNKEYSNQICRCTNQRWYDKLITTSNRNCITDGCPLRKTVFEFVSWFHSPARPSLTDLFRTSSSGEVINGLGQWFSKWGPWTLLRKNRIYRNFVRIFIV